VTNPGSVDGAPPFDLGGPVPVLRRWLDPAVITVAVVALFSGFGGFGAVTALSDVANHFGHITGGSTIADRAGLSGTELGIGLAILRLNSLWGLPLAGVADRIGRRKVLLLSCGLGLACTVAAAVSPSYWWFVAIFAVGRPFLSTTNAVAQVDGAEQTGSRDRAKAIGLITAGYGVGAGLTAVIHELAGKALGFRWFFALAAIPLVGLVFMAKWLTEPDRFAIAAAATERPLPVLGPIAPIYRRRLAIVASMAFCVAIATGPGNSFVFLYADAVTRLSGGTVVAMVLGASLVGLAGLVLGRLGADTLGRRPTAAMSMVAIAAATILSFSGSRGALIVGYELGVFAGSCFAPAAGTLSNELFPTSVRASVAGWLLAAAVLGASAGLLAFGAIADVGNRFSTAAVVTAIPVLLACGLVLVLPETRDRELEDLWG
jgi:MFS family permease